MSFKTDDNWQRRMRNKHVKPFYERFSTTQLYLDTENERSCVMRIQKDVGVDTLLINGNGHIVGFEEKIVRWPGAQAHTAYALETWSCTVPDKEKEGWMFYSGADKLLYAFEQENGSLIAHVIPMQPLRDWFFEITTIYYRTSCRDDHRFLAYPSYTMPDTSNKTQMRLVDIVDVWQAIPDCKAYRLNSGKVEKMTKYP